MSGCLHQGRRRVLPSINNNAGWRRTPGAGETGEPGYAPDHCKQP